MFVLFLSLCAGAVLGIVASLGSGENYAAAFYAAAICCVAGALIGFISSRGVPEAKA